MSKRMTRRRFLKASGSIALGVLAAPAVSARVLGANERLNIAGIGVGGKGESDIAHCESQNIVALCDVDEENAAGSFKKFPDAKRFRDFRKMLDEEGKNIDAVTVSTPDHTHAPAALAAMHLGKHVYCQKPLTHSVHEARLLRETAAKMKVATQMGNQGHSNSASRRLVELIQAGVIGKAREVHVWTDRPIWPQGIYRPTDTPPVPPTLDWDLWLGPAPSRAYHPAYVPFKWRGFWDFGTGALGDMACHNMDVAFWALGLRDPTAIEAESATVNTETAPNWSIIRYEFPARGSVPAIKLTWYDGGKRPLENVAKEQNIGANGAIIAGDKDSLHVPHYWGGAAFFSGARMEDFKAVPETLPRRAGGENESNIDLQHHLEWIEAAKGGPAALSSFEYSGPMTEAVLLGNVALRAGKRIEWDAAAMKVTNVPEANRYVRREYRKGWEA
ncbi:MAG TPA: Gfo/Idh/MocA family oxidoreductase [Planctomycetota bacterium]|nr:Gfo/Idh/MocA family oxidoreductase [Planctomycetota bacterium]